MTDRNQKMREALKEIEATVTTTLAQQPEDDEKCGQILYDALVTVYNKADLACCKARGGRPAPRNCEVGTAREQMARYNSFCHNHHSYGTGCGGCPLCGEPCCELAWAQMPYKEGGAK